MGVLAYGIGIFFRGGEWSRVGMYGEWAGISGVGYLFIGTRMMKVGRSIAIKF